MGVISEALTILQTIVSALMTIDYWLIHVGNSIDSSDIPDVWASLIIKYLM